MIQDEMKRYKAKIAGETYTIIGPESHYHMDIVNDLANEQIELIEKQSPSLSREQAAILLAINTLSVQVKQQEMILDQRKEIEELKEELKRVEELEERLDRIEAREKEARQAIIKEKRQMTEEETLNQIEVQKVLNQQVKEKIQKNNGQKRK
ncbi:cell division protein ZapA [Vagococcus fluvialis]|uniref:cell division protein ZapA n=1 Tax=Vagococcus fluvialis TaxID=2738 RepID=UPI001A8C2C68|nr:cell division protein ZapA [Vagococcus fluvialis]MBO0480370.1 cell division protein ZapA [Vagococcus fluvialis]MBO0485719.1 cell division protein ZapA [Vagococcus fluvialis]UDM71673.1 cell division protein ZapA [Vagococcus fluvialis]UDM76536.1 cell division protein ZapA [Vagococcus fluvialis]UDM83366.1 cell division protein ZapA [Vagococcus fluvialis]